MAKDEGIGTGLERSGGAILAEILDAWKNRNARNRRIAVYFAKLPKPVRKA